LPGISETFRIASYGRAEYFAVHVMGHPGGSWGGENLETAQ